VRRHRGDWRLRIFVLVALAGLAACAQQEVLEDSPTSVSIRYGGTTTLDDATAAANRLCAAYGKIAQLRSSDTKGVLEHYANFNCVSGKAVP
jgi:hypothetical protein